MRDVKRFPTTTGLSWLEMSSFKDHLFKGHEKIGKEYDYVIVAAATAVTAAPAGWPNSSLKPG
mgnify:CR=1 FL=1